MYPRSRPRSYRRQTVDSDAGDPAAECRWAGTCSYRRQTVDADSAAAATNSVPRLHAYSTAIHALASVATKPFALLALVSLISAAALAQFPQQRFNSGDYRRWSGTRNDFGPAAPMPSRDQYPMWEIDERYPDDVFTFVRVQYDSYGPFGWWDRWDNDYPDSDWNFSLRLQQLTSLSVAPESKLLRVTDPELLNYPLVYLAGVQYIVFSKAEQAALRRYLLNGGFMMMDDFWSPEGKRNVLRTMSEVLPDAEPVELTLDHEIFHNVYDLKELPQVVDYKTWSSGYEFEHMHSGYGGDQQPHFFAYHDTDGRMVAILCHNNDIGDGWEREGENPEYFERFSVKYSYPLGINIVTYAMTH